MSKIRILPQCKIPSGNGTSEGQEHDSSDFRRRSWKVKTKSSDPRTIVSNELQKPARTGLSFWQQQKCSHHCTSNNKTRDDCSLELECKPQSNKVSTNIDRKLATPPPSPWPPWALAAALHSLLFLLLSAGVASGELSQATKEMVQRWAPKLWIHHEEKFRPSNVEYFLKNTRVEDQGCNAIHLKMSRKLSQKIFPKVQFEKEICINY